VLKKLIYHRHEVWMPPTAEVFRSKVHAVLVKTTLYLVVWPATLLLIILTLIALITGPFLILALIGWWGIGALFSLKESFKENNSRAGNGIWYGLATSSLMIVWLCLGGDTSRLGDMRELLPIAGCIPVGAYWAWLSWRGFRL
jgi:hypothetical protein